jgi:hypothetical protein
MQTQQKTAPSPDTLFDAMEAMSERERGMNAAAASRETTLQLARDMARTLAAFNGEVTIDDVQYALADAGHTLSLGNAAGSVFKAPGWYFTGKWRKSDRISNHLRVNRVWEYRA